MRATSRFWLFSLVLAALVGPLAAIRQPIRKPRFDPAVPPVGLFEARDQGLIETEVVARNPHEAKLFVTNSSDRPVSIQIPPGVVLTQVLRQIGGFPGAGGSGLGNGAGGGGDPSGGGGAQSLGGGVSGSSGQQGNGGNAFGNRNNQNPFGNQGNGLFTVPPQKTAEVSLRTVCLEHGRPDPTARMKYQVMPVEEYTSSGPLQKLIGRISDREVDLQAAQAAAWHLANGMNWTQLEQKQIVRIGGLPAERYFHPRQLQQARLLVEWAGDAEKPRETAKR